MLDADALQCEGTRVTTVEVPRYESSFTTPALEIRKGMHCGLHFHVINDTDARVVLDTVTVPGTGLHAGAGVAAVELAPLGSKPRQREDDGSDAVFSLDDHRLDAGYAEEFEIILEYQQGCTSPLSHIWFGDAPTVTTADGAEVSVVGPAYGFVGTSDSSCDT